MVLKLYKADASPGVRAILVTANALGIKIDEFYDVKLWEGEHKSPEYLKINPAHTVPTLDDSGFIVTDSHAIITYLAEAYGKNDALYPKDPKKRALVNTMLHLDSGLLFPIFYNAAVRIFYGKGKDLLPEHAERFEDAYSTLNRYLEGRDYVAGNLSVADFSTVVTVSSMDILYPVDVSKFPNIARWRKTMEKLPCYQPNRDGLEKHKALFQGALKQYQ